MFIREELIFAQFRLKGEIHSLYSKLELGQPQENPEEIRMRIRCLQEKLKQVKNISDYWDCFAIEQFNPYAAASQLRGIPIKMYYSIRSKPFHRQF